MVMQSYVRRLVFGLAAGGTIAGTLLVVSGRLPFLTPERATKSTGAITRECDRSETHACAAPNVAAEPEPAKVPTGRPRLLEFSSDDCPVCARMRPRLLDIERACATAEGTVVRIDVDKPEVQSLVSHYDVHFLPTFIRVDAEGNAVERIVGEQTRERLLLTVNEVVRGACSAL
jgi:cytochrome c-type biogenesis protein